MKKFIIYFLLLGHASLSYSQLMLSYSSSYSSKNGCKENIKIAVEGVSSKIEGYCIEGKDGGLGIGFSAVTGDAAIQSKPAQELNLKEPVLYKSNNKVIGGITALDPEGKILISSLHLFLNEWSNSDEVYEHFRNKQVVLLNKDGTENTLQDIVFFIDKDIIINKLSNNVEVQPETIPSLILDTLKLSASTISEQIKPSALWNSYQIGFNGDRPVVQISKGEIKQVELSQNYFYLGKSNENFSTPGSSGSVIFSENLQIPLGVLQCRVENETPNQNTKGLFRILNFDILKKGQSKAFIFNNLLQFENALLEIKSKNLLPKDPHCKWFDGKDIAP